MSDKTVRIGGGSGFWGDSAEGPRQLVERGNIQYLALDYLAEITMSIMARARSRKPELGYATDFVSEVVRPLAAQLKARGVKVVCNAGGVNPLDCCKAIEAELAQQGVALKVAAVLGDDAMPMLDSLRAMGVREMTTGQPIPDLITASAYLGAFPIARALAEGADIVVTGRCADSALALGPLIHEFGWTANDLDALAGGSLAGHVIECGPQSSGGFFTDWREVKDGWADIGFPIAEVRRDGSFLVGKAPGTGGLVSFATVAEQITYETGDPRNYILPDVICDVADIAVRQAGTDLVEVTGVRGRTPTDTYKVSGTVQDGYRALATLMIKGRAAVEKARAVADAILGRTSAIFARDGLGDYSETSVEVLGAEDSYADAPRVDDRREVVLKIAVRHANARALEVFSKEIFPTSTSTVQGVAGVFGGRPKVQPMVRLFSFLVPKEMHRCTVHVDGRAIEMPAAPAVSARSPVRAPDAGAAPDAPEAVALATVPLAAIAWARSGDKGDISNISVIARRPEFRDTLARQVTTEAVARHMAKLLRGKVERFDWPGLHAFNFLLHDALGGGGVASLRYDPQGKAHGQMLLDLPVRVPQDWITRGLVAEDA